MLKNSQKKMFYKCQAQLQSIWPNIQENEVKFDDLFGLSNEVYKIQNLKNYQPLNILAKYKPVDTPNHCFKMLEDESNRILHNFKIPPTQFYADDEIVIEEFVKGKSFTAEQTSQHEYQLWLLHPVAKINSIKSDFSKMNFDRPLIFFIMDDNCIQPQAKEYLEEQLKVCSPERAERLQKCYNRLLEEEAYCRGLLDKLNHKTEYLLSHNDFYHLNFILKPDNEIQLIDFEYTAMNPKGWDIVNLIAENAFYYDDKFPYFTLKEETIPDREQLLEIFKFYEVFLQHQHIKMPSGKDELIDYVRNGQMIKQQSVQDEAVKLLEAFYPIYILVMYQWNWWNFIRANLDGAGADFLYYMELKFIMYDKAKDIYENKMKK